MAGVEHLLRDVKDATVSTLAAEVSTLAAGLSGLKSRLLQIQEYLSLVINGKLPVNHDILYQLQVEPSLPAQIVPLLILFMTFIQFNGTFCCALELLLCKIFPKQSFPRRPCQASLSLHPCPCLILSG